MAKETHPGNANGRRRRIIILIVAVVAVIGLIVGIPYLVYASHHVSTDDAQVTGDITTISPRVKGQVKAVYVQDDQIVRKGDKLVVLDDRDLRAAADQAAAAYTQAQASERAAQIGVPQQAALTAAQTAQATAGVGQAQSGLQTAQAKYASAQAAVSAARSQLEAAQANLTKAAQDESRARALVAQGAIAQAQWDAAKAAYDAAHATRDAAAQGVRQAQDALTQAQAGIAQAQDQIAAGGAQLAQAQTGVQTTEIRSAQAATSSAQVKAAKATLDLARLQVSYATILAPIDGVVSKKSVNVGDLVAAGQPLMAVASTTSIWVTANLKETQIGNVRVGQPVDIKVDAYPRSKFTGKVESIASATGATFALIPPDNASGNFTKVVQRVPVRIAVTQDAASDPALRQGLSVEVTIDTSNH
jgi:membrane fusion protein, multidrug efflux system